MGKGLITDTHLTDIADAIRLKLGTQNTYTPAQMAAAILAIPTGGGVVPDIVPFSSGTDNEIAAIIDAAHAGTINIQADAEWSVGDVRTITINSFDDAKGVTHPSQSIDIVISSFSEYMGCGNVLQIDFKDQLQTGIRMNETASNAVGYGQSEMKTDSLPALANALPSWIKDRLISFSVLASTGGGSPSIETVSGNLLALRSEIEIYGSTNYSLQGEGAQIPYYATSGNRIKKRGHSGSNNVWWERSPKSSNATDYCMVMTNGSSNYNTANLDIGVSPFFCL